MFNSYDYKKKILFFYLSKETIKRSNFSKIRINKVINLEKSLKYGDELSGHYTQGHVDTVGKLIKIKKIDGTWILDISISQKFMDSWLKKLLYTLMVYH